MLIQSPSPVGKDVAIQSLQSKIHAALLTTWGLSSSDYACYDRCYANKKDGSYIAEVYVSAGEYKEVYYDDTYAAVSFFGVSERETFNSTMSVPVHLIFMVDLARVKPSNVNRADEEVKVDVLNIIGAHSHGFVFQGIESRVDNCLKEYPGTRRGMSKMDMHPLLMFRVNLLLNYDKNICSNFNLL
jgi:hypothetical protein